MFRQIYKFFGLVLLAISWSSALQAQPNGWRDVSGEYINAHGGGVLFHEGTYYWFGEHRPAKGFFTEVGVTCYSSVDLQSWKYEGVALSVSSEAGSEIERGCNK